MIARIGLAVAVAGMGLGAVACFILAGVLTLTTDQQGALMLGGIGAIAGALWLGMFLVVLD